MIYEVKYDNIIDYYEVTYDENRLIEVLEELKKFRYRTRSNGVMSGSGSVLPNRMLTKRIIGRLQTEFNSSDQELIVESIVIKKNDYDIIEYQYDYEKHPDLYYFISVLLNRDSIENYLGLFKSISCKYDSSTVISLKDQILIDALFNYTSSSEMRVTIKYDHLKLYHLYKETLESLKFRLVATKEFKNSDVLINGLSLQNNKKTS